MYKKSVCIVNELYSLNVPQIVLARISAVALRTDQVQVNVKKKKRKKILSHFDQTTKVSCAHTISVWGTEWYTEYQSYFFPFTRNEMLTYVCYMCVCVRISSDLKSGKNVGEYTLLNVHNDFSQYFPLRYARLRKSYTRKC